MADEPVKVEKLGIEHVPEELRHGSANRTFTLWFAANLTIADYVVGVITTGFSGFTMSQIIPILLVGNLLGGLFVGLAAAMGPSLGFPQMLSSRASFGRLGNYIPGALNWISTVGWFTVNTILAVVALRVIFPGANFVLSAAAYVIIQAVIAIYGHDFIHLFEKVMSIVLGLLFLLIFVLTIPDLGKAFAYQPGGAGSAFSLGSIGILLIICFSYLMSWAPYASDYSRYFAPSTSKTRVLVLALAGGAISSFAIEVLGALVASLTPSENGSFAYFNGLNSYAGSFGALAMVTLILGAFAADALNLYTNSLSALVLDVKAKRWMTVTAGGVAGFIIAVAVQASFERFFENFLLALSYWIMPWLAIVLVDFYVAKRTSVETSANPARWDWSALAIYGFSILVSVPFMVPQVTLGYPVGALSSWFGGADLSYFISFAVAFVLMTIVRTVGVRNRR
ncbi:MAG: cytosine permease [Nitrososphaerales archaeon]|jgi:NCS1 family nucleobase:cation symporter-1